MSFRNRTCLGFVACLTFSLFVNTAIAQDDIQLEVLEPDADVVARLGGEFKNEKFSIRPIRGLKAAGLLRPESQYHAVFIHAWTPDGKLEDVANFTVGLTPFAQPSSENLDKTLGSMGIDTEHIHAARFHGVEVRFGNYTQQIQGQEVIGHLLLGIDVRGTYAITSLLLPDEATPARLEEVKASLLTFRRAEINTQKGESAHWSGVATRRLNPVVSQAGPFRVTDSEFDVAWNAPSEPKVTKRDRKSLTYEVNQGEVEITLTISKTKAMIESARSVYLDALETIRVHGWKKANLRCTVEPIAHLQYLGMTGRLTGVNMAEGNLLFADFRGKSVVMMVMASGPKDELVPVVTSVIQNVTFGKLNSLEGPPKTMPSNPSTSDPTLPWHAASDAPIPASQPIGDPFPVSFSNKRESPVQLIWIDVTGKHKPYGVIEPGKEKRMRTKHGAVWLITDGQGKRLGHFVVTDRVGLAEIPHAE